VVHGNCVTVMSVYVSAAQLKAATHEHRNSGVWVVLGYHGCGVENMTQMKTNVCHSVYSYLLQSESIQ